MNKATCQALRLDIDAALAAVAAKHGLSKLKTGACKFMDTSCEFKLEAVEQGGITKEGERYKHNAKFLGLPEIGTPVIANGIAYTPTGMNTTGSKVMVTSAKDGKTYLYDTEKFAALWAKQVTKATLEKAAA